jgi:hypothetical protein
MFCWVDSSKVSQIIRNLMWTILLLNTISHLWIVTLHVMEMFKVSILYQPFFFFFVPSIFNTKNQVKCQGTYVVYEGPDEEKHYLFVDWQVAYKRPFILKDKCITNKINRTIVISCMVNALVLMEYMMKVSKHHLKSYAKWVFLLFCFLP